MSNFAGAPQSKKPGFLEFLRCHPGETAIENLVEIALRAYIQRLKQMKILELFGTIDCEESYDYKQQRNIA